MRKRMNLQLFEDGAGAGSVNTQSGNTGTGNGGQNTAGSAAGAHGTGTYTYEQLEEIANTRVERSERTALANFFRSQGMTDTEQLQQERDNALKKVEQMEQEKVLTSKGVKTEDLDYVMFKISKMVDEKTDFKKAAEKFLKENSRFTGQSYRVVSTGVQTGGAEGTEKGNDSINAAIRRAAGR